MEPMQSRIIDNPNERTIPISNKIRIEKNDLSDGLEGSFHEHDNSSGDMNSAEYEYSNYEAEFNRKNFMLQKKYNEILAKRFPGSKSEDTTAHQTPIRSMKQQEVHKYNFKIPKHLKAKSKDFFSGSQNQTNSSKFKFSNLPYDKMSVAGSVNSKKFTKRKLLHSIKEKLLTPSDRLLKLK